MKIDLHVHSDSSRRPSDWILQKIGSNECYTNPRDLYRIAINKGMDAVTITDHNNIDGCMQILDLPNTFLSCEYTTYFPKDHCKVHILCWDINPDLHEQIQEVREDIYEFVDFIHKHNIHHGLAHPLYSINSRLTKKHFEEFLRMFKVFELNGAKDRFTNDYLELILESALGPDKYGLTGGSDDHSGLTICQMYTEVPNVHTIKDFLDGVSNFKSVPQGEGSSPHTLARNLYSIGLQYVQHERKADAIPEKLRKYLLPEDYKIHRNLIGRFWGGVHSVANPQGWSQRIALSWLNSEFAKLDLFSIRHLTADQQWFEIMKQITDRNLIKFGSKVFDDFTAKKLLDIFSGLGMALFLYATLAPYLVAYSWFSKMKFFARDILHDYRDADIIPTKIAKFTDTFGTVDGVSRTLAEQVDEATKSGKDYTLVTCTAENLSHMKGVKYFKPIGMIDAPEYENQPIVWPPFLDLLDYCYEEGVTLIQSSTPGPMGLAGLLIARILDIPFHSVYHTEIPQFLSKVTNSGLMEDVAWKYCIWYYDNAEKVFTPSEASRQNLIKHGLPADKIYVYPRGIDTAKFSPAKRVKGWWSKYGANEDATILLYVGRISKEKNLELLAKSFERLYKTYRNGNYGGNYELAIVGDGDFLEGMLKLTEGLPVIFTGVLEGEELATAFASSDFFVFPSSADTYGRVVMEALSSGLPCVVSDKGGPQDFIKNSQAGVVVEADDIDAFVKGVWSLMCSPNINELKIKARQYAEKHSFSEAFQSYWDMY